jgi:hypothetical protein
MSAPVNVENILTQIIHKRTTGERFLPHSRSAPRLLPLYFLINTAGLRQKETARNLYPALRYNLVVEIMNNVSPSAHGKYNVSAKKKAPDLSGAFSL